MRLTKKQKKIGVITLIVVGALIVAMIGFSTFSLFVGADKIECTSSGTNIWGCTFTGSGGVGINDIIGEKIDLIISEPSRTTDYQSLLANTLKLNSDWNNFMSSHSFSGYTFGQATFQPYSDCDTWVSKFGNNYIGERCLYNEIRVDLNNLFKDKMQKQLIIIESTNYFVPSQEKNVELNLKFYGLCDVVDKECYVIAPNEIENLPSDARITPSSITISFKKEGYTELDFLIDYYRLSNNECDKIYIKSSEKLSNDYDSLSECESNIKHTYYRFLDNNCVVTSLYENEKTEFDYINYEDCMSRIVQDTEENIINIYENLTGETPTEEEVAEIQEEIGEVDVSKEDIENVIINLENKKSSSLLWIIIPILLIVISGLIFAFFKLKKKR